MDQLKLGTMFEPNRVKSATVIGVGALGTAVALQLAKMGVSIAVVDSDGVESHNLPNQCLYGPGSVGMQKVLAATLELERLTDTRVVPVNQRVRGGNISDPHIFMCVDNMETRREIAQWCANTEGSTFVDGRMGARDGSSFLFARDNMAHRERYLDTVHDEADTFVEKTSCGTIMSIGATAQTLAAHMIWQWMDHVMGRQTVNAVHFSFNPWFLNATSWE